MPADDEARLVYITVPDQACAAAIGQRLVEERLAACVNIVHGLQSIYRWQGAVEHASEVLVIAKTMESQVAALSARVRDLHPYAVPCILVLEVRAGNPPYLAWLADGARPLR